jgi:hypothetical protein
MRKRVANLSKALEANERSERKQTCRLRRDPESAFQCSLKVITGNVQEYERRGYASRANLGVLQPGLTYDLVTSSLLEEHPSSEELKYTHSKRSKFQQQHVDNSVKAFCM